MNNSTFTKDFWRYLIIFVVAIVIICFFPFWFTKSGLLDFTNTGQIGDTIGGVMGPFVAIAASVLTFLAFWVQYKANEQQRKDIALERFESNLFQLIQIQEEITNNLLFSPSDGADKLYGKDFHGRQVFHTLYNEKTVPYWGIKEGLREKGIKTYEEDTDTGALDHYFRHLYRVIKYIDESKVIKDEKKYEYTSIVRAGLSQYELIMLFYNCLSKNGKDSFKPLIEKYAIFNNIRVELLATDQEQKMYAAKFEKSYPFLSDENRDMSKEYKKGAFVFLDIPKKKELKILS